MWYMQEILKDDTVKQFIKTIKAFSIHPTILNGEANSFMLTEYSRSSANTTQMWQSLRDRVNNNYAVRANRTFCIALGKEVDLPIGICDLTNRAVPQSVLVPIKRVVNKTVVSQGVACFHKALESGYNYSNEHKAFVHVSKMSEEKLRFENFNRVLSYSANPLDNLDFRKAEGENANTDIVIEREYTIETSEGVTTQFKMTGNSKVKIGDKVIDSKGITVYIKKIIKTEGKVTLMQKPYYGVELEVDRNHTNCKSNLISLILDTQLKDFVILKQDASIPSTGFEIVSVPATMQYHSTAWDKFFNTRTGAARQLKGYTAKNCGMHIHISRNAFTGLHLGKLLRFFNAADNKKFIEKIAGRKENGYCSYKPNKKITDYNKPAGRDAVNLTNHKGTVEIRIFKSNVAKVGFLKNIEFVDAVYWYTQQAAITKLHYKDFLDWLCVPENSLKLYTNLRKWLVAYKLVAETGHNNGLKTINLDLLKCSPEHKIKIKQQLKNKTSLTTIKKAV